MGARTLSERRIWGTLALAISNLAASLVLADPAAMSDASIHRVAVRMMEPWMWGVSFLVIGLGLLLAVVARSLSLVHVFGSLSIAAWTALSVGALITDVVDEDVELSAVGAALFVWMFLGPLAMLLVPVVYEYRLSKELERR